MAQQSNGYDFDAQLDQYRRMAQSITPQYPMDGGVVGRAANNDGFLGRIPFIGQRLQNGISNIAGGADRVLDNGMLAAAMVPEARGPEGVGGGISRALQGVLGAGQYRRQMALQSAMLPYQMMGPQVEMADKMAQIQQRQQLAQHYMAQDNFYNARQKHYEAQEDLAQQRIDNRAPNQQELEMKMAQGMHPAKDPRNPTPEEYGTWNSDIEQMRQRRDPSQGGAITPAKMVMNAYGPPSDGKQYSTKEWGEIAESYGHFMTGMAGERATKVAANTQAAKEPQEQTDKFIASQKEGIYAGLKDPKNPDLDLMNSMAGDKLDDKNDASGLLRAYRKNTADYGTARAKRIDDFATYQVSDAAKNHIPFHQWRQNPNATGTPASSAPSSGKSALPF